MPDQGWLVSSGGGGDTGARIACFAHAGGNPRTFLGWQEQIGADAEVVAVCPPGRRERAGEPEPAGVAELADGAAAAIRAGDGGPIVLFGHSLGALVAFEVARRLRDLDALCHVVASGCAAPSLLPSPRVLRAAQLEGRALAEAVAFFGGLPPEVLADEELCELLLPTVKADLRLVASYRYEPAAPLDLGLTLLNGRDDPHVNAAALAPWHLECRREPVQRRFDGGHFYFEQRGHEVVEILRSLVAGDRDTTQHLEVI